MLRIRNVTMPLDYTSQDLIRALARALRVRPEEIASSRIVKKSLDDTCEQWTIVLKETGKTVGRIILCDINEHYDSLDITRIYIGEDSLRGHGLGREALEAMLAYSFNEKHMERVTLDYVTGNEAADLYRSVGFRDEGNAVHCGKKDGYYVDLHKMAILSGEYYDRK